MDMFEWLDQEIFEIETPRFHIVDGPVEGRLQEAILESRLLLPRSYREFVIKFGSARLYRSGLDSYHLRVFAGPRRGTLEDGTAIYHVGIDDDANVYIQPEPDSGACPVFEVESGSEVKVADDFGEWLSESCARVRSMYGKKRWSAILRGPKPFSAEEGQIVESRKRIRWRVLGIDSSGNHIFEINNAGSRTLPVLTVGVRSRDRRLNGAVELNIRNVGPGQRAILHVDCYKDLISPHDIEAFALPDPLPEDREHFGELVSGQ